MLYSPIDKLKEILGLDKLAYHNRNWYGFEGDSLFHYERREPYSDITCKYEIGVIPPGGGSHLIFTHNEIYKDLYYGIESGKFKIVERDHFIKTVKASHIKYLEQEIQNCQDKIDYKIMVLENNKEYLKNKKLELENLFGSEFVKEEYNKFVLQDVCTDPQCADCYDDDDE